MATYIRNNAWNNGGSFDNTDLLWYARGVGEMQSRSLDNPNSWWFFAAIHGEYVTERGFPGWGSIPAPPQVPTMPIPTASMQDMYWNQCQHQSWYFPPWHRGYLMALEAQIRAAVVSLGGPLAWALPYWNYLGPGSAHEIPPAFNEQLLPDGSPNTLFVTARYGPHGNGNIFVEIPPVSQDCMSTDLYTGSNANTPPPGFGGPDTGFSHGGGISGRLEGNPHNLVHVDVGGDAPDGMTWGLMSDPGIAALDPIFYLHHANIDRMWAIWNANGNANPTSPNWLNGPAVVGQRKFVMPMPDGSAWVYIPSMVNSLVQLDYTYDDLSPVVPTVTTNILAHRLRKLGVAPPEVPEDTEVDTRDELELVGANDGALQIKSAGVRARVRLDPDVSRILTLSLEDASVTAPPDNVYLQLENVRGTRDAHKLTVYIDDRMAGTVSLFGLRRASLMDGLHGGQGLSFDLDITSIIDELFVDHTLDSNSLDVRIVPDHAIPDHADISVERVSVYRQKHR